MGKYDDYITGPVTVIGIERHPLARAPNGIQCDECGEVIVIGGKVRDLATAKDLGWTEFLCPECNGCELRKE